MLSIRATFLLLGLAAAGCSPLKTSPHDEKHQLELTLNEVQTNLDDLRHDVSCFQTELAILDGRLNYYDQMIASLKAQDLYRAQEKLEELVHHIQILDKKIESSEKQQEIEKKNLKELSSHAEQTSIAFTQFKGRLLEIEQHLAALGKLRLHLESLAQNLSSSSKGYIIHKVASGDSLKKIAKQYGTTVEEIRSLNHLRQDQDLIVIGQELKISTKSP